MNITICRQSVCMADDGENHVISYRVLPSTTFSDIFQDLISRAYFPRISGNDVVWTLFCGNDDLISWKTKENQFYSRFVAGEPAILSVKCRMSPAIDFRYYSPPIKRAQQIFLRFHGSKFHLWHEGFGPEYKSYAIPRQVEAKWLQTL